MRTERPWRAVAYLPDGAGGRHDRRRTAASCPEGLLRFRRKWEAAGYSVDVWEVLPVPEVAAAVQQAALR